MTYASITVNHGSDGIKYTCAFNAGDGIGCSDARTSPQKAFNAGKLSTAIGRGNGIAGNGGDTGAAAAVAAGPTLTSLDVDDDGTVVSGALLLLLDDDGVSDASLVATGDFTSAICAIWNTTTQITDTVMKQIRYAHSNEAT